jgi:hypothetical protein
VDGSVFAVYQGAFLRRASASAGWWPAVAYQQTARAWQASMNGMVRSTAAAAPRPRLLPSAALRVAGRSPPGRITIPLPSALSTSSTCAVHGTGVDMAQEASMSQAAERTSSSSYRLPATRPHRRPIAAFAAS